MEQMERELWLLYMDAYEKALTMSPEQIVARIKWIRAQLDGQIVLPSLPNETDEQINILLDKLNS